MGIHGLLQQIGHGERIALAKLSCDHFTTHSRPFRLAIDISIWLFQIQSGKGGSNPALRTFYYRLLRLMSLNIHPLFVFDGPNKPLFKRNKKVGGPGVRVASVPEFLAKQLLKQFGFPWHVAPGEAEAECALLQSKGIVDAVLSEDVDTLMFGSGVTLRNWTAENTTKTPTHVDVHRAEKTKESSGMDEEGMILVALMSGGDYLPEGIPGCGPKLACDAARAGFGRELCELGKRKDAAGLNAWKDRLLHEIRTNESKFFSRRNKNFTIPEDFPNLEVLGYYTNPCTSTTEKLERVKRELRWDQSIDFAALRTFTADAFDWRCLGGAKKFIKNLAPALLVRELRLRGDVEEQMEHEEREEAEKRFAQAIHGKRNHNTTGGELEYRIIFTPTNLVPIDLTIEDEDDDFTPAGGVAEDQSDAESDLMMLPPSTQEGEAESEAPVSPSKKRNFKPYHPDQPEKLWMLRPFLQIGCPLLVEDYEASQKDPRAFLMQKRTARAAAKGGAKVHAAKPKSRKGKGKESAMPDNAIMSYAKVTKANRPQLKETQGKDSPALDEEDSQAVATFNLPFTQIQAGFWQPKTTQHSETIEVLDLAASSPDNTTNQRNPARPFAAFARVPDAPKTKATAPISRKDDVQKTPRRNNKKRSSPDLASPAVSQRTITSFYSPSPHKAKQSFVPNHKQDDVIELLSSSPVQASKDPTGLQTQRRPLTPTPPNTRFQFIRNATSPPPTQPDFSPGKLPDTVTKRRKKSPLKRFQTEPVFGHDEDDDFTIQPMPTPAPAPELRNAAIDDDDVEVVEIISSPTKSDGALPSPSTFIRPTQAPFDDAGGFIRDDDTTAKPGSRSTDPAAETQQPNPSYPSPPTKTSLLNPSLITPPNQPRRPPHQKKKRIQLRESLEGAWKEVDAETIDMTGNGSESGGGRAKISSGWRKSGVEVLDLTGV